MAEPKVILQIIRCTTVNRTSYTPRVGEMMFETDTQSLYIGDGTTAGGIVIATVGGEVQDGANVGTAGVGIFKQKTGAILQFKKLNAGSNKVTITDDTGNDEVDIDITESNFTSVIFNTIINTKGDIIVGTADNTVDKLSTPATNPEEYELIPDDSEPSGLKWGKRINNEIVLNYVNQASYNIDLLNDHIVVGVYSSSDMIFQFNDPTLVFTVGHPGREYVFKNGDTTGKILTVKLFGTDTFQNGLNEVKLYNRETLRMGYVAPNIADGAFLLQPLKADLQIERTSDWSATNFSSPTPLPFDVNNHIHDLNIIDHSTTVNNSRVTFGCKGYVYVHYWFSIDSTGGSTYNVESYIRKNGTDVISGSQGRTGNYQNEDTSLNIGSILVKVDVGDYIEVMVDHTNLTGNILNPVLQISGEF